MKQLTYDEYLARFNQIQSTEPFCYNAPASSSNQACIELKAEGYDPIQLDAHAEQHRISKGRLWNYTGD